MPFSICLNMIVKNEAGVIQRCLEAVRSEIDYWVIVDTGSSDGTQALVRDALKDIPGELHERPWRDFGHNRTEALRLAEHKADYLLLIDADMVLQVLDPEWKRQIRADACLVTQITPAGFNYRNVWLINARLRGPRTWRYWGVTHEYLDSVDPERPAAKAEITGIRLLDLADGGSRHDKYQRDAALLETELGRLERADTPEKAKEARHLLPRTLFYLAQTYRDLGKLDQSVDTYRKRAELGGWAEEVWYSLYQVAQITEFQRRDDALVAHRYLQAYQYRPSRAEPLVHLAGFHRKRRQHALAHLYAQRAMAIPQTTDVLFVEGDCYGWRRLDEYAVASYWVGDFKTCERICMELLASPALPESQASRVRENLEFARAKLR